MSLISKALKKIQESRQDKKTGSIVYLSDSPKPWPKLTSIILISAVIIVAISTSITAITITLRNSESRQSRVRALEESIKNQEKRINDFIVAINKNQKITDGQIRDLNFRLNKEGNDAKAQSNALTLIENDHYSNLKNAIIDDKQEIDLLNNSTKILSDKIEAISTSINQSASQTSSQPQDTPNLVGGN